MINVGKQLKDERERKNLSLHEVGMALKINAKILSAIEEGQLAKLPAKTFLRGFVKSYAHYLKMDSTKLLIELDAVLNPHDVATDATPQVEGETSAQPKNNIVQLKNTTTRATVRESSSVSAINEKKLPWFYIAIIFVLFLLIWGVSQVIEKYEKESSVEPKTTTSSPVTPETAGAALTDVDPQTVNSVSAPVNNATTGTQDTSTSANTPATPMPTTSAEPEKPKTPEAAKPEVKKESAPVAEPAPTPAPPATVAAPVATTPTVETAVATPVASPDTGAPGTVLYKLKLEALNKVDVHFTVKGKRKDITLKRDQKLNIKSEGPIVIEVSDGGAVNLYKNDQDTGVMGPIGKPTTLELQ